MIMVGFILFAAGIVLSAFFSGIETGFYRASRVRLVIDSLSGDMVARSLLVLTNRPAWFVATVLIGNNVANNLTSFAIVLAVSESTLAHSGISTLIPVILAPFIFVYGELLPKYLFFRAPNRLLRLGGPFFLLCSVLFLPVALLLWGLSRLLQSVVGQPPLRVRLSLARKELRQLLQEGQEAGILAPSQRQLAQGLVELGPKPVKRFSTPIGRVTSVPLGATKAEVLRLARRHRSAAILVREEQGRTLIGYVTIVELRFSPGERVEQISPLLRLPQQMAQVTAHVQLRAAGAEVGLVVDDKDEPIGLVSTDQLSQPLFAG